MSEKVIPLTLEQHCSTKHVMFRDGAGSGIGAGTTMPKLTYRYPDLDAVEHVDAVEHKSEPHHDACFPKPKVELPRVHLIRLRPVRQNQNVTLSSVTIVCIGFS